MKPFKTDPSIQLITAEDVSNSFETRGKSYSNTKNKSRIRTAKSSRDPILKNSFGNFSRSARKDLFNIPQTPGPGQYEFCPLNSSPAYTLIGRSKEIIRINPGPGSYNTDSICKQKGWKIGKSQRSDFFYKANTPGPGQYQENNRPTTPSWAFSKDYEGRRYISTPGPGAYETKILNKGIEYKTSKAKRKELFQSENTPGPGSYDTNNIKSIFNPKLYGSSYSKLKSEVQNRIRKNRPNLGIKGL